MALLPGALFHPPEIMTSAIDKVVAAAKAEGLAKDDALDALLRMEARLHAHSRVKPSYAYRADAPPLNEDFEPPCPRRPRFVSVWSNAARSHPRSRTSRSSARTARHSRSRPGSG
ncbi:MAG: hypothetical protein U0235_27990 [Polyangiaceae bacterium]